MNRRDISSLAYVLTGTLRRAGARLRINTQLVDTRTDFPVWSERFDREMKDVFEVQDEIARKIAEALRVTLSPQELEALAVKPTENLQAYDLYLRGKRYARRQTRQDLEFALQMFENAVTMDPSFALAYAACANACAMFYCNFSRDLVWVERAREASGKAVALRWDLPEVQVSQAWVLYAARCAQPILKDWLELPPGCAKDARTRSAGNRTSKNGQRCAINVVGRPIETHLSMLPANACYCSQPLRILRADRKK
jgi:hypothetical protein